MNERPIFIVGCPRSGTTLLRDLLRSHSRLSFPRESGVIPALFRAYGDPTDFIQARRLASDLLRSPEIATWGLGLQPWQLGHHRSFAALVGDLYRVWAAKEEKPRWGDKTPLYVLELETLLEVFPDAQVIYLLRDGRDVALSLMARSWGPGNAYTAARMWRQTVKAGRQAAHDLDSATFIEVRYERLVTEPEAELRRICHFLSEAFEPAVLKPSRLPILPGDSPRPQHLDREIAAGSHGRWRAVMSEKDRTVFESVAADELTMAGYPLAGPSRRSRHDERARWRLQSAGKQLYWRLGTSKGRSQASSILRLARARLRSRSVR